MATLSGPKGAIYGDAAEELLADAQEKFPGSEFVASVWHFFEEKGFVTEAQADALQGIIDGGEREE